MTLVITLSLLLCFALIGQRCINLPINIWTLFIAQPLAMSSAPMIVFAGGFVATKIAPRPELATVPLTAMILGTAAAVIPASMLMKKLGRRLGTIFGLCIALVGALLCSYATAHALFSGLVIGAVFLGASMAFVAQMRFAAIESLADKADAPKAVSILMISGMFAAIIGPETAVFAKDWLIESAEYSGSFLALAILIGCSTFVISRLKPITVIASQSEQSSRPLPEIIKQPLFIIAVCSGAIAYAVMSYVMTAAPLSMHHIDGHQLTTTKWVVQSHIIAMYLPSLFSAFLIRKFGISRLMLLGVGCYGLVVVVALSGQQVMHYWWVMVLLGIGWNFLFTSGTLILPQAYHPEERFKAQASNDFFIFFIQAMASLSAGMILFNYGWQWLVAISIPLLVVMLVVSFWYFKQDASRISCLAEQAK